MHSSKVSIFNKTQLLLHFVVFIWGFTGVLGKLISLDAEMIVWYRMIIAAVGLLFFMKLKRKKPERNFRYVIQSLLVGFIVAVHWFTFFQAIKVSNISVALVTISTTSFFTALIEPLFYRRRIILYEVLFGVLIVIGISLIFSFETRYKAGIFYSLISALLAALFSVLNGKLIERTDAYSITLYEMIGGFLFLTFVYWISGENPFYYPLPSFIDFMWLLILGLVCTAYAFVVSVDIMKVVSPYTVAISVNLEPVYSIIMALLIFGSEEYMSSGFYLGTIIILATIFGNAYLKSKKTVSST